jgi:hypothetical protein
MNYDFIAIPDQDVPQATDPLFHHLVVTSETNKTANMWKAIFDDLLEFKPDERVNTIRAILVHQILSERRFFAQFVGSQEPPVEELLTRDETQSVQAYQDKYITQAKQRLPQLAEATANWWLTAMSFFGGVKRQRIWTFWRRGANRPLRPAAGLLHVPPGARRWLLSPTKHHYTAIEAGSLQAL